jgi:PPP family 3-phenylpropionic acid transporter
MSEMAPIPGITAQDGFAWRLSVFYAAFFVYAGITLPFLPVWLASKGLAAAEIGIVLATPMLVRPFAVPAAARLADRFAALREALVAISMASVAGLVMLAFADRFATILAALAIASVFLTSIVPLADAYALRGLGERRRAYGPVRLWGSVSFIVASLAGGVALSLAGAGNLIWTLVIVQMVAAGSAMTLVPLSERSRLDRQPTAGPSLWKHPMFIAVLAASSLIQASHSVMYGFGTLLWTANGLDGPTVGALWSMGVVAEIVLFAFAGRVVPAVGATGLVVLGGLGGLLRWAVMAFDPPAITLPLLQCLHALSYGATHLGTMTFLAGVAGYGRHATAQGDYVAVQGAVFALTMGFSGAVVDRFDGAAYAGMAMMAAAGTAIAIVARRAYGWSDRP